MQLLAISGSLRAEASNTVLLQAAVRVAQRNIHIALYDELGALPHFNPDLDTLDGHGLPPIIHELRSRVGSADGLLISCPEYAHGIPGSFKNLLDWLVGSTEFPGKPVALLNTSALSVHAPAQLVEVLATMNARVITGASITIPIGRLRTVEEVLTDSQSETALRTAIAALVSAIDDNHKQ